MYDKKQLKDACVLFNSGILKIQDANSFALKNYVLCCNSGILTNIKKENEKE
jgi:hypothetical protein